MKKPKKIRIQKLLSEYGVCSRRKAEDLIKKGKVKVNRRTVKLGDKASYEDKILVNNRSIKKISKKIYIKFHKPEGLVTSRSDGKHKTIFSLIKTPVRLFPVGRLDKDTSGLLLLTNDGDWANKISHPKNEIEKTYLVKTDKPLSQDLAKKIEKGVKLKDGLTSPVKLNFNSPTFIELKIHEGRNRIIRKIFGKFKITVTKLKRIQIGKLRLGDLEKGKWENISPDEV